MGVLLSTTYRLLLFIILFLVLLSHLPDNLFPDFPFDPVPVKLLDFEKISKTYNFVQVSNKNLNQWLKNQVIGPEAFEVKNNFIYTGLADGRLVEINKKTNKIRTVVRFNKQNAKSCVDNSVVNISSCGRVLGLRFGKDDTLYALDAMQGLFKINITKGTKQLIGLGPTVPSSLKGIFNNLVVDPDFENVIYITVSSNRWSMDKLFWSIYEGERTGFVLSFNLKNGKLIKILDNLFFPNGMDLSADKKNILISVGDYKILKVPLIQARDAAQKGAKINNPSVFIDNLPGLPDNIRQIQNEIFISIPITQTQASLLDRLIVYPKFTKSIGRAVNLLARLSTYIDSKLYSNAFLKRLKNELISGQIFVNFFTGPSSLIVVDSLTGKLKRSYKFETETFSEAYVDPTNDNLYLASFSKNFIGFFNSKDWRKF